MKEKAKKSRLDGVPAWALSVLTLVASIAYVMLQSHFSMKRELADQSTIYIGSLKLVEITDFVVFFVLIPLVCFSICSMHPKSVWYAPIICNAVGFGICCIGIIDSINNPAYTTISDWIIWGGGSLLAVTGAIIGARIGRSRIDQA